MSAPSRPPIWAGPSSSDPRNGLAPGRCEPQACPRFRGGSHRGPIFEIVDGFFRQAPRTGENPGSPRPFAPRAGFPSLQERLRKGAVAPFAGAWIETASRPRAGRSRVVAPFAGRGSNRHSSADRPCRGPSSRRERGDLGAPGPEPGVLRAKISRAAQQPVRIEPLPKRRKPPPIVAIGGLKAVLAFFAEVVDIDTSS